MVKRLRKSVQYIRRYLTKYDSFFGRVAPDVHKINELCQLWSYWTEIMSFSPISPKKIGYGAPKIKFAYYTSTYATYINNKFSYLCWRV